MELATLLSKAESSSFYRWLLNRGLWQKIPFNHPHRLIITSIHPDTLTITAPYIRKNKNHLNGIHACCLATLCEYVCGLSLIRTLDAKNYRLIMKDLHITYHYQAKMAVSTSFSLSEQEGKTIRELLATSDAVLREYTIDVTDNAGNAICTAKVLWQIKPWNKTKTSLN
jgi:acyl-coenzyme A thioesterase PaaI-like protein